MRRRVHRPGCGGGDSPHQQGREPFPRCTFSWEQGTRQRPESHLPDYLKHIEYKTLCLGVSFKTWPFPSDRKPGVWCDPSPSLEHKGAESPSLAPWLWVLLVTAPTQELP